MAPTTTVTIGKGTKGAVISGQTITWPRRRRQDHTTGFVLNIDLLVNRAITAVTKDADGYIITTTVSGDISTWVPATEGLTTTINNTTTDVFADSRTAALAVAADDVELILTPTLIDGLRFERFTIANAIPLAFDGMVFETDEVGTLHFIIYPLESGASLFSVTTSTGSAIRDMWIVGPAKSAILWSGNAAGTDTLLLERSVYQCTIGIDAVVTIAAAGFAKKVTVNNCIFHASGREGSGRPVIEAFGALAHVINVNHSLVWRCGRVFGGDNALQAYNIKNTMIFGATGYDTGSSVNTYTDCLGDAAGRPTGVALSSEEDAFLLFQKSPAGAANLFLTDMRPKSNSLSSAFQAGQPITGVTEDIDGRPRSLITPTIGPTEGFLAAPDLAKTPGRLFVIGILG